MARRHQETRRASPTAGTDGYEPNKIVYRPKEGAIPGDNEKLFSQRVYDLARLRGWLAARYPTFRPTHTTPGYPDLTLTRGGRLIFAELKMPKARPSAAQAAWLDALRAVPCVEVYVWRPEDWEEIVKTLERDNG